MLPSYYYVIYRFWESLGMPLGMLRSLTTLVLVVCVVLIGLVIYWIIARPVAWAVQKAALKTPTKWDDYIVSSRTMNAVALVAMAFFWIYFLPGSLLYYPSVTGEVLVLCKVFAIVAIYRLLAGLTDTVYKAATKEKLPFHGLVAYRNLLNTIFACAAGLCVISVMLDKDIGYVISALGAMAAVLMLVFRDTILGLVAGIKLTYNHMLHEGDWITVPKYNANGVVEDIRLSTIKVRNFDNSVTLVPPYALLSDGFSNFEEMRKSGGRRVMRSLTIDVDSIRHLSPKELEALGSHGWLKSPDQKKTTVNITLFRRYLAYRIGEVSSLNTPMTHMVRELQPTAEGVPIEVYFFTKETEWVAYETLQADFMDEIVAEMPRFGLRIYQRPSGLDLRQAVK